MEPNNNLVRLTEFKRNPAQFIDHTRLAPSSTQHEIDKLCDEATRFNFKSVCVNPCWVRRCKKNLESTGVAVCTVIGFPLGANTSDVKANEAKRAVEDGAAEIDLVMNVGLYLSAKSEDDPKGLELMELFKKDILQTLGSIPESVIFKVIIETSLLNPGQISEVSRILSELGRVHFVKTSTGFNGPGANIENVGLIRAEVNEKCNVKASGGIKTWDDCIKMIENGAGRIGTSSGVKIMQEWTASK